MSTPTEDIPSTEAATTPLPELAWLFLRLGLTAFGGPAAHIALMRQECVERRKWLTSEQFLDLLGASNLVPGPSSTELAIHIGFRRAGWLGLLAAGVCFILPAFLLVMAIAWVYVKFGRLPQVMGILYGVKPVVIAIILQALWNLGKTAVKTRFLAAVGVVATGAAFLGVNPLAVLFGAGAIVGCQRWWAEGRKASGGPLLMLLLIIGVLAAGPTLLGRAIGNAATPSPTPLFLVFLKLGAVVYGSGYVLLAFLRTELVTRRAWLTAAQLLDSVAVGQVTPGPVFTTATFIGYVLAGPAGAAVATFGIFLPAFVFVAVSGPLVSRIRQSPPAGAFLDGVNVASLGLMAVVTWELGRDALRGPITITLALVSALLLLRYRVNSAWLLLGGAIIGILTTLMRR
jgi:chromate transporter